MPPAELENLVWFRGSCFSRLRNCAKRFLRTILGSQLHCCVNSQTGFIRYVLSNFHTFSVALHKWKSEGVEATNSLFDLGLLQNYCSKELGIFCCVCRCMCRSKKFENFFIVSSYSRKRTERLSNLKEQCRPNFGKIRAQRQFLRSQFFLMGKCDFFVLKRFVAQF